MQQTTGNTVRKGDMVQVMAGKDKGKTGKILRVVHDCCDQVARVVVEKTNMVKRHTKPTQQNQFGGLVDKESPIHVSNVLLLCPKCNKGVRFGIKKTGEKKNRICKKCGESL